MSVATRFGLMGLSFLLSLLLYLYVQSQVAPTVQRTVQARVHVINQNADLYCERDGAPCEGASVDVRVTATQDEINRLEASQELLKPTINLGGRKQGSYSVRVNLTPPRGMEDMTIEPTSMSLNLEPMVRESRQLEIRSKSDPKTEATHDQIRQVSVDPSVVYLTGPKSLMANAVPYVLIDFSADLERVQTVPIQVEDGDHNPLPSVRPDEANADVHAMRFDKSVYLNVEWVGHPAVGFEMTDYKVLPSQTIEVRGPALILDNLPHVNVTVDLSGLKSDKSFQVIPKLPDGVTLEGGQPVTVNVTIARQRR